MEVKIIATLIWVVLIGCSSPTTKEREKTSTIVNHETPSTQVIHKDVFYNFIPVSDSSYKIEWGNSIFKNVTEKNFELLGSGTLNLLDRDDSSIILMQGCGTSCIYYVVLPMKLNAKEQVFMFAQAYDIENNLVAYIPEDKQPFIRIENYLTGQHLDISESNLCPAAFKGDCIDTSYFTENRFILKWQGNLWRIDKSDLRERIVPINF
jgi:hypothetical protein